MSASTVRVGMGQLRVAPADREGNLRRAREMVLRAREAGCRVVVLPECLDAGWGHPSARELARPIPGETADFLRAAAREAGLYVVAGLTERDGDRLYNAALLLSPEGEIRLHHRKINLLTGVEGGLYSVGDRLGVARTEWGTVALNICADNFRSSLALAHAQVRMGAQVLLSPSAWAVPPDYDPVREPYGSLWKDSYGRLARLYPVSVVGVSCVGPVTGGEWAGWKCIGCSLAVGPGGAVLAEGPYGEEAETLVPAEIPLVPPPASGTSFRAYLAERGYNGP